MPWIAAGAVGAAAVTAAGNYASAQQQQKETRAAMSWQSEWDRQMYQKRYQYTVEDMKAAGINPIMAASGGFSVGPHPSVSLGNFAKAEMPNIDFMSSAKQYQEIKTEEQKTELTKNQAETEIEKKFKERASKGLITAQEREAKQRYWNLRQEFNVITQKGYKTIAEKNMINVQIKQMKLALEQLRRSSQVYSGSVGELIAYLNAILGTINVGVNK